MSTRSRSSESTVHLKKTHALLDRRDAERAPLNYRVTYTTDNGSQVASGEGIVRELSKTGCKILSTDPLSVGVRLTLFLDFQDGKSPLCLVGAKVCWVEGNHFGVKFPTATPEERQRLQHVILKHLTRSGSPQQRTAFRIT
ncbi:protein of unknown function [Nitrospira japonica]|uniref:PilZ domain-containing protein n=1 Tax=Nitrospira japonica TaxID=1325564 RepID=A0A1W1I1Z7_9BACT|nr:protein of unknown function [Nitrospira japonica]